MTIIDRKSNCGFTLIEIIIVVAILGIIAAIAIPTYLNYITSSKIEAAKATIEQFPVLLETYRSEKGRFPANNSYVYSETATGVVTDTITNSTTGAGLIDFKPRKISQNSNTGILYRYKLTISNSGSTTETAAIVAIPETSRGGPPGNITSTYK